MGKTVAIVQSNYIPWKGYFDLIRQCDDSVLYDEAQYTKNDWRNRNRVKTPSGPRWLTLPVLTSGKFGQRIMDAVVGHDGWRRKHWSTISQAYARAPFFREHRERLESLYLSGAERNLSRVNRAFIAAVCSILGIGTRLTWSTDYDLEPGGGDAGKTARLVAICKRLRATEYLSGPSAKEYLDEDAFEREGISVRYMDYAGYPEYAQLYPPFEHRVSVLDLIFSEGPDAARFLKRL